VCLAVLNSGVDQLLILGLLGCSEDEGGVRGSILGLVLVNGGEVTRVAYDGLLEYTSQYEVSRCDVYFSGLSGGGGRRCDGGVRTVPVAFN
jgi:hypothetical protein